MFFAFSGGISRRLARYCVRTVHARLQAVSEGPIADLDRPRIPWSVRFS